jgi:hypothetical protein
VSAGLELQLREFMIANPGVSAYLGQRWYFIQLPQANKTYPAATVQRISTIPDGTNMRQDYRWQKSGWCRLQITVFVGGADSAQVAEDVSLALQDAMRTFNPAVESVSPQVSYQGPNFRLNRRLMFQAQTEQPILMDIQDWRVWYRDSD